MADNNTTEGKRKRYKRPSKPIAPEDKPLDTREQAFVDEYLIRNQPMQAAIAAGYSVSVAKTNAYLWISNSEYKPHVYKEVTRRLRERRQKADVDAVNVLKRWWQIATADPNELTQLRRECCRHCYGEDHEYQWRDEAEFERAMTASEREEDKATPHDVGGYGFNPGLPPHPGCPRCDGEGKPRVHMADTRYLSEEAKALFAGVEMTKEGVKIKMHDQQKAMDSVARHLGMYRDKIDLGAEEGNPLHTLLERIAGNTLRPGVGMSTGEDDQ